MVSRRPYARARRRWEVLSVHVWPDAPRHVKGFPHAPSTSPALLVRSAGQAFERGTVERRDVGPHDVLIDIAYAGICHSDIHQAREEWGPAIFPMVPGHEIAGTVREIGSAVTTYAVGDRVGIGCFVDSCRECENCLAGEEQFCLQGNVATYNGRDYDGPAPLDGTPTYGGYSTQIVADEKYVLRIPDGMPLDTAAPLLCAGITTYSPLRHWNAGPGTRVAVIGMGGLGHMAVQIAHAMGAHVTVLPGRWPRRMRAGAPRRRRVLRDGGRRRPSGAARIAST